MRARAILLMAVGLLLALPAVVQAHDAAVEMKGSTFQPGDATVAVGESVTWTNMDPALHDAVADDGSWKTERLNPNQSASVAFDTPGSYPYRCTLHGPMRGTITVVAAAPNTDTDAVAAADGRGAPVGLFMLAVGLLGLTFAGRRFGRAAVSR